MGKKVREYKSGDFIFAKVKGYPAWPARVQRPNGKKYFVYFYGTGETANLPPNQIFDYAENKEKFLTKTVKRKDFNDGARQIEHDFANNVPLEDVIGVAAEEPMDTSAANDTANDTADDSVLDATTDTTVADTTAADETNTTAQHEAAVEDSDEGGALVIDEGKKGRKSTAKPAATPKPAISKTPRGKSKKEADDDEEKKEEEIISRSGRKIRPKRYIDEQTEENSTLPSPAPKKKRGASPAAEKDKPEKSKTSDTDKSSKHYNAVTQTELEELKEPFVSDDADKENLLIACLPSGQYIGIKLFQSRPTSYRNDAARLQWDQQAASNAITLKSQLEKGHITPQSVSAQLEMDLNLTDEEKANLDKEREIEEKKSRVQFLKTEMKLIELDAKIKSCLSLEKADTDLCLKLLDELMALEIKTLMLLKHPTCLETLKRMRAYVGNTPSWELSEAEALVFSKQAHLIRNKADKAYLHLKDLFVTPDGLSFWEYFSERVVVFKKATAKLTSDERLEMVNEPLEMTMPSSHTMKSAIEAANEAEEEQEDPPPKKTTPAKSKKAPSTTPTKAVKRQSSRTKVVEPETNKADEIAEEPSTPPPAEPAAENDKEESVKDKEDTEKAAEDAKSTEDPKKTEENAQESSKETEDAAPTDKDTAQDKSTSAAVDDSEKSAKNKNSDGNGEKEVSKEKEAENEVNTNDTENIKKDSEKDKKETSKDKKETEKDKKESSRDRKDSEKDKKETNNGKKEVKDKKDADKDRKESDKDKKETEKDKKESSKDKKDSEKEKKESSNDKKDVKDKKDAEKDKKESDKDKKESDKDKKESDKDKKETDKDKKETEKDGEKEKEDSGEPRAKRGRENNKKTESPKSPNKRKLRS